MPVFHVVRYREDCFAATTAGEALELACIDANVDGLGLVSIYKTIAGDAGMARLLPRSKMQHVRTFWNDALPASSD